MVEDYKEEWKEFWKDNGEPHPASNAYLALTRAFWFTKGMEYAIKMEAENGNSR